MPEVDDLDQTGNEDSEELYERLSITVDKGQEPMRLDKFLQIRIEGCTFDTYLEKFV
jgi:23S rRNA pseudouridine1911/1915/1917 synthase